MSILADRIREISDPTQRELFTCLFSGILEFNNLFASYKGEGTGAIRHMFAHHILKPERVPLEANLWGTPRSSGSFSTMFKGRILRALDYAKNPFELRLFQEGERKRTKKVFGLSEPIGFEVATDYETFKQGRRVNISCGDSGKTDLDDESVDAVVSDPPFFDNVHYSELADFFYVWQRHILGNHGPWCARTTRSMAEVQSTDAAAFTERLAKVWREAHRVLADDGILVFTYHHSCSEGWSAVLHAVVEAGFGITAVHPIKSEMSVAMPKFRAKEPIDLDVIIVCRKRSRIGQRQQKQDMLEKIRQASSQQVDRFNKRDRGLSRNDIKVIAMAQVIRWLSLVQDFEEAKRILASEEVAIEAVIRRLSRARNQHTKQEYS